MTGGDHLFLNIRLPNEQLSHSSSVVVFGDALWRQGLAQRVIDHEDTPRNVREAALLVKSPEMVELHLRRARTRAATRKASMDIIRAVQTVVEWTNQQGWSK